MNLNKICRLLCVAVIAGAIVGIAPVPPAWADHQTLDVNWDPDSGSPTSTTVGDGLRGPGDRITFSGINWAPSAAVPIGTTGTAVHISVYYATSTVGWHEPILLTTCPTTDMAPFVSAGGEIEQPCFYVIPSEVPVSGVTYTFLATQTWSDGMMVTTTVDVAGNDPSQPSAAVGYSVIPDMGTTGTALSHTGCGFQTLGASIPLHPFMSPDNVDGGSTGSPTSGPIAVTQTATTACPQGGSFDVNGTVPDVPNGEYWVVLSRDSLGQDVVSQANTERFTVGVPLPDLSVNDPAPVLETDQGQTSRVTFTVTLSESSEESVTATVTTQDGTAKASQDYQPVTRTLAFAPGTTTQTVTATVVGDDLAEGDEDFFLKITGARNADIADDTGRAVIDDDDPGVSVNDPPPVLERDAGQTSTVVFTLTLSPAASETVTVTVTTQDGSAKAPQDYQSVTRTVVFPTGTTTQTVTVTVNGDDDLEGNEDFFLKILSARNADILDDTGRAVITDNEVGVSVNDPPPVQEKDSGQTSTVVFTLTLSTTSSSDVTVTVTTRNGSATAPQDYQPVTRTVVFPASSTTQTVTVTVNGDELNEGTEDFFLDITGAQNAKIDDGTGRARIADDERLPVASVRDAEDVQEGDAGPTNVLFIIELSEPYPLTVVVTVTTEDGTAEAGSDYNALTRAVVFPPNSTSQPVTVTVNGDTEPEDEEFFFLNIDGTQNATPHPENNFGVGLILDDDGGDDGGNGAIDGAFGGGPAAVSWGDNRIDVFVRGSDDALWHKWWDGTAWHGFESLGGVLASAPEVSSWDSGRLDVFVKGTDDGMWHLWYDGTTWRGWESLGGVLTSDPSAVSWGPNRIDLFVRGTDEALWHQYYNGAWSGWESLGGTLTSGADAASWGPNRLDVFVRGTDGALYHQFYNGAWSGWASQGGLLIGDPSAVSWGVNRIDVFARGTDDQLYHNWFDGVWRSWEPLGGVLTASPDSSSWAAGRLDVFVRGTDGGLWHKFYAGGWSGYESLGGFIHE